MSPSQFLFWDWWKDAAYQAIPIAFTVGLVGGRVSRGRVGRLVDDLSSADEGGLEAALARALGDPSVEVLYRVEGSDGLVDAAGRPRDLPSRKDGRDVTPLVHGGQRLGVLVHDGALSDQPELVGSVCAAAGLALANQRLQAEVRAQLAEVRASRSRIVQAGDAERRRIERNLHDGAQQRLVATRLSLRLASPASTAPIRIWYTTWRPHRPTRDGRRGAAHPGPGHPSCRAHPAGSRRRRGPARRSGVGACPASRIDSRDDWQMRPRRPPTVIAEALTDVDKLRPRRPGRR